MSEILSYLFIGLHVRYPIFLSDFNRTWIFSTDFRKYPDIRFVENPSSGSRVIPCGRMERRTDMRKLTVALRIFANASKKFCLRMNWYHSVIIAGEVRTLCERAVMLNCTYIVFLVWQSDYFVSGRTSAQ